ncbi:MAG: S8 family serine peptidase [Firmicutes bacterium]|nr:S8 family serine peptidase [Bacillota bacterium]
MARVHPARRRYIALLDEEAWNEVELARDASFLGLGGNDAVVGRLPLIRALVVRLPPRLAAAAPTRPPTGVLALCPERLFLPALDRVRRDVGAEEAWGLPGAASPGGDGAGAGACVALVDSGVHPHPDLCRPSSRLLAFVDLVHGRRDPYDDCGHGTHLAGVIAGGGVVDRRYRGVAPRAGLVAVKALDEHGRGRESVIISAIEWCVRHRRPYGISVLNLSVGAPPVGPPETDPTCRAVRAAWREGIVVVTSLGNAGPATSPAAEPSVIAVAAADLPLRPSPQGGRRPDLLAPGAGVVSLAVPQGRGDRRAAGRPAEPCRPPEAGKAPSRWYAPMSGASVAAAVVSGVAALMVSARGATDPERVKADLVRTAEGGLVRADAAVRAYLGRP